VRVLLSSASAHLDLMIDSPYSVFSEKRELLFQKGKGESLRLTQKENQIFLGDNNAQQRSLLIVPMKDGTLKFKGNRYRGVAKVTIDPKGKLTLINILKLEDYLRSVVAGEVSSEWPEEVLKAQAIAARTYAYYHMVKSQDKEADITSPLAQNYQGVDKEKSQTSAAVEATKGEVLYYHGYLFPAFFHSTCGGGTEFPQNVWALNFKIPEIVPCDYCKDSPHFQWDKVFSVQEIETKFRQAGYPMAGVQNIYPAKISKNRSHITEIALLSAEGEKTFRINEFRRILGFNNVKSAKFKVMKKDDMVFLQGWGWGHGVGMCQWGAKTLASEEKSYRKILSYYYPDCHLKKVAM
jgi:stage II sporulation protein D